MFVSNTMQRDTLFIALLILIIVGMFTFGSRLGMKVQTVLAGPIASQATAPTIETLSQTVEGYGMTHTTASTTQKGIVAPVYSRYPFNLKNEILIAAGGNDGVKVGDVALFQGSLLGSVEKVFSDSALVQT